MANAHPFREVVETAARKIGEGWTVYQQWWCGACGVKQTMPDENKFYIRGRCEECGAETDLQKAGHNFMASKGMRLGDLEKFTQRP